ncbi:C39 family peptidase [Streptomyces aquilus]|nr:C39 family peptidase [Streptomyces aquilus]
MPVRHRPGVVCALVSGLLAVGLVTGPAFAADDIEGPDDTDPASTEMATSSFINGARVDDAGEADGTSTEWAKQIKLAVIEASLPDDDDATTTDASGATAAVSYNTIGITTQMQQKHYWCGPAAGRAALTAFSVTKAQSTLATKMHTDSDGTYASKIPAALNAYQSRNGYKDSKNTSSAKDLFARVKINVDGGWKAPLIPLVQGHSLPIWSSNGYHGLHFITLYGYGSDGVSLKYFDPVDANALYGRHAVNRKYVWAAMNANYGGDGKADNELVW